MGIDEFVWNKFGQPWAAPKAKTMDGLRPTHVTVGSRPSTQRNEMERVMGIEPTLVAWEATVLPLNYTRAAADFMHPARRPATLGKRQAILTERS